MEDKKNILMHKGVCLPLPQCVEIGDEVDPERILAGVTIHGGSKIYGRKTLICKGAQIGYESPVTIENCHLGPDVLLAGGFFKNAVFLKGAKAGPCAHVREGTIFEESASIAHTVGLKQTILFPYVTIGSLVNFCDCLMAGGTDAKNHSEVGSSYIHFNFTPLQDKATPSIMGDVPRGVMLNQEPIFLGGQGGLVGPARLAFGTVIAAGTICRKDEFRPGRLIFGGPSSEGNIRRSALPAGNYTRIITNNVVYIGNLAALHQWYVFVRRLFICEDFPLPLYEGLIDAITAAIDERVKRLEDYICKIKMINPDDKLLASWDPAVAMFRNPVYSGNTVVLRNQFLKAISNEIELKGCNYMTIIKSLSSDDAKAGTAWLDAVVADSGKPGFKMLKIGNSGEKR